MKNVSKIILAAVLVIAAPSCSTMNKILSGGLIGTGAGAALGAGIGYLVSGDAKGAAIGAAVGGTVGATTGAVIGGQMEKKAKELEALENAAVETITDANGLTAIKVTFESGILFATNSSKLGDDSRLALSAFATTMNDLPETDITIWGHTDNTGSYEVNQRVSGQRAQAVKEFLVKCGMQESRLLAVGKAYDVPVADNDTEEGRAQNRRVEIYVTANEAMISAAQQQAGEAK